MRIYKEKGIVATNKGKDIALENLDVRVTKDQKGITLSIATTDTQLSIPLDRIAEDLQKLEYI